MSIEFERFSHVGVALATHKRIARRFAAAVFLLVLVVGAGTAHAAGAGGSGLPWEAPLTTLSNSITGPVAYTISICGIVGCGAALIFLGGVVSEFLRGVLFVVLVIAVIITAKNTLT